MNIKKIFSKKILNYKVKTQKYGSTNYVNLDNAATTPPLLAVEKGVADYLISYGSVHRGAGTKSKISTDIYEDSREVIKDFVNAPKDNYVIFTTNTTEAINTAAYFFSFLSGKVAVSEVEHSSSWLPWIETEGIKMLGSKQVSLPEVENENQKIQELGRKQVIQYDVNDKFEFCLEDIEKILKENKIKVVVLTAASNITGYCPDIKAVGELAHKYGAYFLVDACQFIQHHKIDMQAMGIDFFVASGHKFYAPYGDGFLIGSKSFFDEFLPYQIGGGNLPYITQEGEFLRFKTQLAHDPGTPNAVGAVSMAIALKTLKKIGMEDIEKHDQDLTAKLFDYLASNPKVELYVSKKHLTTVIPFNIKGVNANEVAEKLNSVYGIGVRAGSFCVYKVVRKLLNITDETEIIKSVRGGSTEKIPSLIRASIGLCNTEKDIKRIIEAIKEITK
ncbi:MAG: aminotransferase class V-fold PLP-dependent enzyme [Candidatus Staskawiczbacteria bacterium]|nr:aminotransferase class V-fold PLP-dependent enzyme [Candidatus Staskawiczbacteria bacterium]